MTQVSARVSMEIAGMTISGNIVRNGETVLPVDVTLAAAKAGTLTTRTDANTGVLTVATGHGITTSDLVGVFWSGGSRQGMTVSATTGTTITVDGGTGTDLPIATSVITVAPQITVDVPDFQDADLQLAMILMAEVGYSAVSFVDSGQADVIMQFTGGEPWLWAAADPVTSVSPFTTEVVENIYICNGVATTNRVRMGFVLDSVSAL